MMLLKQRSSYTGIEGGVEGKPLMSPNIKEPPTTSLYLTLSGVIVGVGGDEREIHLLRARG